MYILRDGSSAGRRSRSAGRRCRSSGCSPRCRQLGIHEGKSGLAVLGSVALMSSRIVAVAAVWVGSITVRLDLAG